MKKTYLFTCTPLVIATLWIAQIQPGVAAVGSEPSGPAIAANASEALPQPGRPVVAASPSVTNSLSRYTVKARSSDRKGILAESIDAALQAAHDSLRNVTGLSSAPLPKEALAEHRNEWILGREVTDFRKENDDYLMELGVTIDTSRIARYVMAQASVAELSQQLDHPNLVIALSPRLNGDNSLADNAVQRVQVFETVNAAIGKAFMAPGIKLVSPSWIDEELGQFRGSSLGRESEDGTLTSDGAIRLRQNIRYHSLLDNDVDYTFVGAVNFESRTVGGQVEVSMGITGEIVASMTETDEVVAKVEQSQTLVGATRDAAIRDAAATLGTKVANSEAIPMLIKHFRDTLKEGRKSRVYLFHDGNEDFALDAYDLLKAHGKILRSEDRTRNIKTLIYLSAKLSRAELNDSFLLRSALRQAGTPSFPFQIRANRGEIYIAPKGEEYDAKLQGIIEGARYLLKEYQAGVASAPPLGAGSSASANSVMPAAVAFQQVADQSAKAVGVVVRQSDKGSHPMGTAWATRPQVWITNAHVEDDVAQCLKDGISVFIYPNLEQGRRIRIIASKPHPQYRPIDVALLKTEEAHGTLLELAEDSELLALRQGDQLVTMGFAMENIYKDGVNLSSPIAPMQIGSVVAVSDPSLAYRDPSQNILIRHNLHTGGGASGSPILAQSGKVVGIHFAGNYIFQFVRDTSGKVIKDESGQPETERIPVSGQNRAWRADTIRPLLNAVNW